jgi:hypothetical protein
MKKRMKKLLLLLTLSSSLALAQTTTTVTGTIKDLSGAPVTSGQITFTLQPSPDATMSGLARFSGQTITCLISGAGQVVAANGSSPCTITMNTALQPPGSGYVVNMCPAYTCTATFFMYAVVSSVDITTVISTPAQLPSLGGVMDTFSNQTVNGNKAFAGLSSFPGGIFGSLGVISGSTIMSSLNGVLNPASCGSTNPPTWCSGSDIGAWVNAAIAALPAPVGTGTCGEISIPAGVYIQATSIMMSRCVKLHGASAEGTRITWTPTTGWAFIVADNNTALDNNYSYEGAIEDLTIVGPGATSTAGAVYFGGSDGAANSPSTAVDPATNHGDHFNLNRVRIFGNQFNVCAQWGTNAWSTTIFESELGLCATGVLVPSTVTNDNTGEEIAIVNSSVSNNTGVGVMIGNVGGGNAINISITNSSLDFNGSWGAQNGTSSNSNAISITNSAMYAPAMWLQNYGIMNLSGNYFTGGGSSGTLGYLIDNESQVFVSVGGQYLQSGTGALVNAAGTGGVWIAPFTGSGPPPLLYTLLEDRFGNIYNNVTTSSYLVSNTLNQSNANRMAGTSACSSGTKAILFGTTYTAAPTVLLFDYATKGGINLSAGPSTAGFTASCTGASDSFGWMAIGNPN